MIFRRDSRHRGRALAVPIFISGVIFGARVAFAAPQVEFIVDFSASMSEGAPGQAGTDLVRGALRDAIAVLPPDVEAAVRVYGHRAERERRLQSCRDTELLVPFQRALSPAALRSLEKLQPRGLTPLAHAIAESAKDFRASDGERSIILITDGADTCEGDPVAVIRELQRRGFKIVVHTIGLNLTPGAREQLSAIAAVGGGIFTVVGDLPSMRRGMFKALKLSFAPLAALDLSGEGDLDSPFDAANEERSAAVIPIGREFRRNRVGGSDDAADIFRLPLKNGEKYHGVVRIPSKSGQADVTVVEPDGQRRVLTVSEEGVFEFDLLDVKGESEALVRIEGREPLDYQIQVISLVGLP